MIRDIFLPPAEEEMMKFVIVAVMHLRRRLGYWEDRLYSS